MGVEDFLSHEPPAPEEVTPDEVSNSPVLENEAPAGENAPSEDTPPSGMDKRDQAIWREERNKRKELQQQVEQMNQRWQDMMQRMQAPPPPQQQAPQQPPQEEIPAYDEDPLGHLKARNDLLERQLTQAQQFQMHQAQQAQQVQQFAQLRGTVDQMETEFASEHPDYHDAVGHLYAQLENLATAMGYPPEMKQQIVSQTAMDISVRALQQGRSPAQLAYEAAKQMGWNGASSGTDELNVQTPPSPAVKPKSAPTSLGAVAGKSEGGNPTWDAISKMDDKEFDAWWKKFERQQRGR